VRTLAVLHDYDEFVLDSEELLVAHDERHTVLLYLVVQVLQNLDLSHPTTT